MRSVLLVLTLFLLVLPASAAAVPQTLVVTRADDDVIGPCGKGGCTLRQAMAALDDGDEDADRIELHFGSPATIALTAALPTIDEPLAIVSTGPERPTISGDSTHQVLSMIDTSTVVELGGLTITRAEGSGILAGGGTLTVRDCVLSENASSGSGGAIASMDTEVVLERSLVIGNRAVHDGGGIAVFGGSLFVRDSRIVENSTGAGGAAGAGIAVSSPHVPTQVIGSTIARNRMEGTVGQGAGAYIDGGGHFSNSTVVANTSARAEDPAGIASDSSAPNELSLFNSIVAGNGPGADVATVPGSDPVELQGSLVQSFPHGAIVEATPGSNLIGVDPGLRAPTADHLYVPLRTSPVVDQGWTDATTDARGLPRPVDLPHVANATYVGADGADMGAVELTAAEGTPPPAPPAGGGPSTDPPPVLAPPVLSGLAVRRGRRIAFTLDRAASVRVRLVRRVRGKARRPRRTLTVAGVAGRNVVRLRGKRLRRGRYLLRATPSADGLTGVVVRERFRVRRR